jgi:hypothetical protein
MITGTGSLYQSKDYPFIGNHSGEISHEMKEYEDEAINKLQNFKNKFVN